MRLLRPLVLSLTLLTSYAVAQDADSADVKKEKHNYQSDVARLRKIVINSLYSHKDVFLRELISNANDALEKLRLSALKDRTLYDASEPMNITIKAVKNSEGPGGRLIITDTGIGMTAAELSANLGTLAKSGTSDFLAKAEGQDGPVNGNLIGAFGLGFYSSFLVADTVHVASISPKTDKNPSPIQHVFSSSTDDSSFEIFADPRGSTLGTHGTEITLFLKEEAAEYLDESRLNDLVAKHSQFSSGFPVFLYTQKSVEVPDDTVPETTSSTSAAETTETPATEESEKPKDEDEAVVEEVDEAKKEEPAVPKTKTVLVDDWVKLNPQAPLWAREPKDITTEEYEAFYQAYFRDQDKPLAYKHFSGDSGSGTTFKALLYIPSKLANDFWQQPLDHKGQDIKLMVKRTLITNDFGKHSPPKWASWLRAVIDADDLPLNVSRETLQSTRFLKQLRTILLKHILQIWAKMAEEDTKKFEELQEQYRTVIKLGAVEDLKNRDKLVALTRFATNHRNFTSLDQYLESKKTGQKQIFYINEIGKEPAEIAKSVFVEKLDARGYEVLLLNEPIDEILVSNIRNYKGYPFQDIAKTGLKFGDEDLDEEDEKERQKELAEQYKPLLEYLKKAAVDVVRDVVISNRLVTSPCAVVADSYGYTANTQKMMSSTHKKGGAPDMMAELQKKAKILEINPKSPLIEGLLRRIEQLPTEEGSKDQEAEDELSEVTTILIDGALIRSGFEVPDTNGFFSRVDRVLRRSLGVSETAKADSQVKPAPAVDPEVPEGGLKEPEIPEFPEWKAPPAADDKPGIVLPKEARDDVKIEMEEIDEDGNVVPPRHDEL